MALTIHGRFFHLAGQRCFLRAATYGPFPPGKEPDDEQELERIAAAGFQIVRTYQTPSRRFLDLLAANGLTLITTIPWHWDSLFLETPETLESARRSLSAFLREHAGHPALGALLIANEIRPDLVRFMGPLAVRDALEELITFSRAIAPQLPIAYSNFPTTEYLEPRNADFSAFNVYLEEQGTFTSYLRRLQNIAGDRPLFLTEFGYSTYPRTPSENAEQLEDEQVNAFNWSLTIAHREGTAGFTAYAWSDLWQNGGVEVTDWSFGLTRRDQSAKPALAAIQSLETPLCSRTSVANKFSIALCIRNGGHHLRKNLPHFEAVEDPNFELIIIDDGSTDDTREIALAFQSKSSLTVQVHSQEGAGLSAARNHATRVASGEFIVFIDDDARPHPLWLHYLRDAFARNPQAAAAGGPNISPYPTSRQNAVVTACPGNASHILFTDTTAEHLPGCNLAMRREILIGIGGFDEHYHTAGDDVDLCWRVLDEGHELAFHPAACVFHDRRATIKNFIKQQAGYGQAEAYLYKKHPQRFGHNGIRWQGFIYSGAPLTLDKDSTVCHGPMGSAPYQMLSLYHMPVRPLHRDYDTALNRRLVKLTHRLAQCARHRSRKKHGGVGTCAVKEEITVTPADTRTVSRKDFHTAHIGNRLDVLSHLISQGWKPSEDEERLDLEKGPLGLLLAETPVDGGLSILHLRLHHPLGSGKEIFAEVETFLAQFST